MKTKPIHASLYKPILFVGCERLPFILVTTVCGILMMAYQRLWMFVLAFIIYLVCIALIRRVNKLDPQYFRCLFRYITDSQDYYPSSELYPGKPDKPRYFFGK